MFKFIKEVIASMKKVTWPTLEQNRSDTSTVVWCSILFAAYLGVLDFIFQQLVKLL